MFLNSSSFTVCRIIMSSGKEKLSEALIECLEPVINPLDEGMAIARDLVAVARDCCQGVYLDDAWPC
jgi:hypothetical protein